MAASIGGVSCDNIFHLGHKDPMERIEVYEPRGVNGAGLFDVGQSVGSFSFECKKRGSIADVNTWSDSLAALKGSGIISCTDDRAVSYSNLQVMDMTDLFLEDYEDGGTVYQQGTHILSGLIME